MTKQQDDASTALLALKFDFLRQLSEDFTSILNAWERLIDDRQSEERRYDLEIKAHSLAGNSGILGLSLVAEAASELENAIATLWPTKCNCSAEIEHLTVAVVRTLVEFDEQLALQEKQPQCA